MTYSIVAQDPSSNELGVAVQSHWFAVGPIVPWAEAGVGAIATQSFVEVSYGPLGLELMREGKRANEALHDLLEVDEQSAIRQVAMIDAAGSVAVHTGAECIKEAGHRTGKGYSVQANLMLRDTVWDAMAEAFEGASGDLIDRLLSSLDAGEAEGGDIRGRQSAAILVVRGAPSGRRWEDTVIDLRVDDHTHPLEELRRLVRLHRAYEHAERAEDLESDGDREGALREREAARSIAPESSELAFWAAVSFAQSDRLAEAREAIAVAYREHDGWRSLLRRMASTGQMELSPEALDVLLGGR